MYSAWWKDLLSVMDSESFSVTELSALHPGHFDPMERVPAPSEQQAPEVVWLWCISTPAAKQTLVIQPVAHPNIDNYYPRLCSPCLLCLTEHSCITNLTSYYLGDSGSKFQPRPAILRLHSFTQSFKAKAKAKTLHYIKAWEQPSPPPLIDLTSLYIT
jgi:hypothetical protein